MRLTTKTPAKTKRLGEILGRLLGKGDLLTIVGDLGAGKTTFIQGLAIGMGVKAQITSPTFTIIHEYPGDLPLYHIDAYRLETEVEILELGLEEYFYGEGVTAVEWPERISSWLPAESIKIEMIKDDHEEDTRTISINGLSKDKIEELVEAIKNENFGD